MAVVTKPVPVVVPVVPVVATPIANVKPAPSSTAAKVVTGVAAVAGTGLLVAAIVAYAKGKAVSSVLEGAWYKLFPKRAS